MILVASADPSSWHQVKKACRDRFSVSFSIDLQGTLNVIQRLRPTIVIVWSALLDTPLEQSISKIRQFHPDTPVIAITTKADSYATKSALKSRAGAYLSEGEVSKSLLNVVNSMLGADKHVQAAADQQHASQVDGSIAQLAAYRDMVIGTNPRVKKVMQLAGRIATFDVDVLITGETGTGKEVLSRWIHCFSHRTRGPFEVIDLTAIPDELFESILFGHERGSFTGATSASEGGFQRAQNGTLFLDEISSLKLDLQPKLLRAIQEKEVRSVGGRKPTPCDVRIIAATNIDLADAVSRGEFRTDLYYRLNVVTLNLVPLRERKEDIPILLEFFFKKHANKYQLEIPQISAATLQRLANYNWPGNIRELENWAQRVVLFSNCSGYSVDDFLEEQPLCQDDKSVLFGECNHSLEELERLYIHRVLEQTNGNQSRAAQILQISRKTLYNKLQQYSERKTWSGPVLRSIS